MWVFKGYFKYHSVTPYGTYPPYIFSLLYAFASLKWAYVVVQTLDFFIFYKHIIAAAGLFFIVMKKLLILENLSLEMRKVQSLEMAFSGILCIVL